ncbi:MAG: four helix bundle protein [Chthoniobacterales bacterium]|nr:four helix bundle protein [Chthoniobacterales bacterium]
MNDGEEEGKNIEHPTSNAEHRSGVCHAAGHDESLRVEERVYDLEELLLEFAAAVIRLVRELPKDREANHVAGQLLRSGTSPLPNHGEAEAAESPTDFIHKLKICLKELRETRRWLLLILRVPLLSRSTATDALLQETDELTRIFVASIRTATKRTSNKGTA